jgi:hypothetical protein
MTYQLMECGHRLEVRPGATAAWCPFDAAMVLVRPEDEPSPTDAEGAAVPAATAAREIA